MVATVTPAPSLLPNCDGRGVDVGQRLGVQLRVGRGSARGNLDVGLRCHGLADFGIGTAGVFAIVGPGIVAF